MRDSRPSTTRFAWLGQLPRDARLTLRNMAKAPTFFASAIVTIALGVGLNTAVFSVVHALLIAPLPYKDSDRLVRLITDVPADPATGKPVRRTGPIAVSELLELRAKSRTISHAGVYANTMRTLTGTEATTRLDGWRVEPLLFEMLGAKPLLGRVFRSDDALTDANRVVLLSHGTWRTHFGGDPNVIGRTIVLDGAPHEVVGVMPGGFDFPIELAARQFWLPLVLTTTGPAVNVRLPMLARLADGVPVKDAVDEVNVILRGVAPVPATYDLIRLQDQLVAPVKPALLILMGAVGIVLLLGCVNVANLMIARNVSRRREVALRVALGARPGQVALQLLTESVLLALIAAVVGSAFAAGGIAMVRVGAATLARSDLGSFTDFPRLNEVVVDGRMLGFALTLALLSTVFFGLLPALRVSRIRVGAVLRESAADGVAKAAGLKRALLLVGQVALATLLLVWSVMFGRSFANLIATDPGYQPDNVLTFQIAFQRERYPGQQLKVFAEEITERLRAIPNVRSAAYAVQLPMVALIKNGAGFSRTPIGPIAPGTPPPQDDARFVSRDYLDVMGIPIVAGRNFGAQDGPASTRVIIINQKLARQHFDQENPIGQTAYIRGHAGPWEIVGVATDVRQQGLDKAVEPQVFVNIAQWPDLPDAFRLLQYFAVRTSDAPLNVTAQVRDVVRQIDSNAGLFNVATMDQLVANSIARPRLYAALVGLFAAIAVVMAVVGIVSLTAYTVSRRTREIGIRISLGARRIQVIGLVFGQIAGLTIAGITLGLAAAMLAPQSLDAMLVGLVRLDPLTFATAAALFLAATTVGAYFPLRQAMQVDPIVALRSE